MRFDNLVELIILPGELWRLQVSSLLCQPLKRVRDPVFSVAAKLILDVGRELKPDPTLPWPKLPASSAPQDRYLIDGRRRDTHWYGERHSSSQSVHLYPQPKGPELCRPTARARPAPFSRMMAGDGPSYFSPARRVSSSESSCNKSSLMR